MTVTITKNTEEIIKSISKEIGEPPCLQEYRLSMWNQYLVEELPSRVAHLWKYSNPKDFIYDDREIALKSSAPEFIISDEAKLKGVILTTLKEAFKIESIKEMLKSKLSSLVKQELNKMNMLNEATWSSGYFLYVPNNVVISETVIVNVQGKDTSNKFLSSKILVIMGENSSLNLIGEYHTPNNCDVLSNVVLEMFLGKNAKLNYLNLQLRGNGTTQHLFHRAELESGAELTNLLIALGGKNIKSDIGFKLIGENAYANTYGIVLGDENQKFDHHTVVDHVSARTKSGLDFRVALKDNSRSAYTGNLRIRKEAIACAATQENRNLLLSETAVAESIPELEIFTEEVTSCKHGVTVGQVDKNQIFYLMSRGLTEKESEKLIIEGFLEPTISRVPDETLKLEVKDRIKSKLASL